MACWVCLPGCDKCRPKFFTCPHCGGLAYFSLDKCPVCRNPVSETDREKGLSEWQERHREAK